MDDIDTKLMALLAQNARMPVAILARDLKLARTTVQARIERLERRGHISGYTIRRGQAGQAGLRATVLIAVEPRMGASVLARLQSLPDVTSVHTTTGRFDMIATLQAPTSEALDITLDHIGAAKGVRSLESLVQLTTKFDRR